MNILTIKIIWASIPIVVAFIWIQPIHSLTYITIQTLLVILFISLGFIITKKKRWAVLVTAIIGLVFYPLLGTSGYNKTVVMNRYLTELKKHNGVNYVWGGENKMGIDCSGLPRSAMILSLFKFAYFNINRSAYLMALSMLYSDASAKELLAGYGGKTQVISDAYLINSLSPLAKPGDMAITVGGVHVMVYLDASTIIQADPSRDLVAIDKLPCENDWYNQRVKLVRWNL